MGAWIRKTIACVVIFALIFILIYNILEVPDDIIVGENEVLVREANKMEASFYLSVIVGIAILEVIQIFLFIEKTNSPQTVKKNILKLLLFTVFFVIFVVYLHYMFRFTSVPLIKKI